MLTQAETKNSARRGSSDAVPNFRKLLRIMCLSEEYGLQEAAAAAAKHLESDSVQGQELDIILRCNVLKGTRAEALDRATPLRSDVLGDDPSLISPAMYSSCWRTVAVINHVALYKLR